jgi:hypothetical protein
MPTQSVKTECTITMQVPTGMRSPLRHFERPEEGTQAHHRGAVRQIDAVRVCRSRSGAKTGLRPSLVLRGNGCRLRTGRDQRRSLARHPERCSN